MHNKGNTGTSKVIKEAFDNNQLYELFIGKTNKSYSQYGATPTDPEYVYNSWLLFVNDRKDQEQLWKLYENIIIEI